MDLSISVGADFNVICCITVAVVVACFVMYILGGRTYQEQV